MRITYPLGFLLLLLIPILVGVYLIKNKYTEQTISSTYLWNLSEKFLKRRNPISKIVGVISLILQIIIVALAALALARPVLVIPGSAGSYYYILDGSGSMNLTEGGKTRLELGKEEISSRVKGAFGGSSFTLVYTAADTQTVFENVTDKEKALTQIKGLSPSYTASDFSEAVRLAQTRFLKDTALRVVLVTDKEVECGGNVEVVKIGSPVENYAVTGLKSALTGDKVIIEGKAISYNSDKTLTLGLYVDGANTPVSTAQVRAEKGEFVPFAFECGEQDYTSLRVAVAERDAFLADSECILFNTAAQSRYRALLVSDSPYFMEPALKAYGALSVTTVGHESYRAGGGYDLYVFDGYSPEELPKDGAVWFVNPRGSVDGSGFSYQNEIDPGSPMRFTYTNSSATLAQSLLKDVGGQNVFAGKYVKCGVHRKFTPILSHEGDPVLFAGVNDYGNREAVFAFDLHNTTLPLQEDFVVLTRNLLSYTFPAVVEGSFRYCGEVAQINSVVGAESIRVESPSSLSSYFDPDVPVNELRLEEAGVYRITVRKGETSSVYSIFAAAPEEERIPSAQPATFLLEGEVTKETRSGFFDKPIILFIILAVVLAADWAVYCYEQSQLR